MITRTIFTLLLSCMSMTMLSAQKPGQANNAGRLADLPEAKKGDLICRCITTFTPKKDETFFFKMDETFHEVALNAEGISVSFPVRGSSSFALYSKTVNKKNETVYLPLVQQELTGTGGQYIIMLNREKDEEKIKSSAYNINSSNFPANGVHLFNQCPLALGIEVQDTKAVVKPYEKYTYSYKDAGRNTYTSAKIVMRYKGENKIMSSKRLRLVPGRRIMLFCFPSQTRATMGATPLKLFTLQDAP